MNMKQTSSVLAAAVALACAGQAGAVTLTGYDVNDSNTVTVRMGGATATASSFLSILRLNKTGFQICSPNTLDVYRMRNSDNYRIFACTGGTDAGTGLVGKKLVFTRNGEYGSGQGVSALVKGTTNALTTDTPVQTVISRFPDPANTFVQGLAATSTIAASGNFASYVLHNDSSGSTAQSSFTSVVAADIGVTDVEPAQFAKVFNPNLKSGDLSKLTIKTVAGTIFGVPVTKNIYQRLQAIQFASSSVCHPSNAGYGSIDTAASVANSEACMPSLSRDIVAGIYSGFISDWASIVSPSSTDSVATVTATGITALTDTNIYVERRVASSGTQVSTAVYFLNQNCGTGAQEFVTTSATVNERAGSGDVVKALANYTGAAKGAIGVLSTESLLTPDAINSDATTQSGLRNARFIKINGAAPSLLNVVKGTYDFYYESTMQYRNALVGGVAALTGDKLTAFNTITAALGDPETVALVDKGFTQTFGRTGLVTNALDFVANVAVPPFVAVSETGTTSDVYAYPVATNTRGNSGSANACLNPIRVSSPQASN